MTIVIASEAIKDEEEAWCYRDLSGTEQGPFTRSQMEEWAADGASKPSGRAPSTGSSSAARRRPRPLSDNFDPNIFAAAKEGTGRPSPAPPPYPLFVDEQGVGDWCQLPKNRRDTWVDTARDRLVEEQLGEWDANEKWWAPEGDPDESLKRLYKDKVAKEIEQGELTEADVDAARRGRRSFWPLYDYKWDGLLDVETLARGRPAPSTSLNPREIGLDVQFRS